ncbi:hypothetical protein ANOM_003666 [Aspergillus nomiae NRRL 13137]|uniref:U3-containing 90S pre-ribosomal complex subunit-domain containing protein n=1 Tax=Aspergillus nomiae NRRL (strain ATCC 15546 / NRRL 13137 / CBS 260.88 / M93) TaxID=1509407 RepID=A0A0L1J298_ASPN3|nr:uncharacterized protein ANOM_003666 [Aspergillus nomiae NRRL 13137]KNG85867.1 hypothetical protein ANOM_003666 [Aspergillus nomiae NRRL 13137]
MALMVQQQLCCVAFVATAFLMLLTGRGNGKSIRLSAKINNKRKRQAEESSKQTEAAAGNADGPSNKKSKKGKSKPKKGGKDKKDKPQQDASEKEQRDTKQTETKGGSKRHNKELTAVELSDLSVPESSFLDTSSFDSARQLEKLPAFLKAFSPKGSDLSRPSEEKGTPHTLVVSPSGLRAADAVRALRTFQTKESPIGKLFAKHIKLEEAKKFLERSRIAIGGGTPARISDLIDAGSLKLGELQRIVIDGSYVDQKQRGIFDMKETHLPLLKLLTRPEFRERYGAEEKRIHILVF